MRLRRGSRIVSASFFRIRASANPNVGELAGRRWSREELAEAREIHEVELRGRNADLLASSEPLSVEPTTEGACRAPGAVRAMGLS